MLKLIRRRLCRSEAADTDRGTALILALLVVLLVGALLAAVLDFVGVGFTLAPNVKNDRNRANYLQGAVEGAINSIRGSQIDGVEGQGCHDFDPPAQSGLSGAAGPFHVTCEPKPVPNSTANLQPRFAINALGTGSEGIRQSSGNDELTIDGGVYSHGVLSVTSGSQNEMTIFGTAAVEGACSGAITTTDVGNLGRCNLASASPQDTALMALGADPLYHSSMPVDLSGATNATMDRLPTCVNSSSRVNFTGTYYSERPDRLAHKAGCNGSIYYFAPGKYYFDYTGLWDLGSPGATRVVGGTPGSGLTNTAAPLGTSCDAAADVDTGIPANDGVQFVFGGTSRVMVSGSGALELCGPSTNQLSLAATPERFVALYGLSAGNSNDNTVAVSAPADAAFVPGGTEPTGSPEFSQPLVGNGPSGARTAGDGSVAVAQLTTADTATLTYGSFADLPVGAKVTSVKMRITHTSVYTNDTIVVRTPAVPGGTSPITVPDVCAPCDVSIPLSALAPTAGSDPPSAVWREVNGVSLTYTSQGTNIPGGSGLSFGTETVDGLELRVSYEAPGLHAQSCTGSCTNFFNSTTNPDVIVRGTVYTPAASWAVSVHNNGETIFSRGVIVRNLDIDMSASSKQGNSPFQLPRGNNAGRMVLFRGYVDNESAPRVRACVVYNDTAPTPSGNASGAFYGWSLSVRRWNLLRQPVDGDSCSGITP